MEVELDKTIIKLPANAFFNQKYKRREFAVKVGDDRRELHNFFLDTKSAFTHQIPVNSPTVYHFSALSCSHPHLKQSPIITVEIAHGKVAKIVERKPFE